MSSSVHNTVIRNGLVLGKKLNFHRMISNGRYSEELVYAVQCWDRNAVNDDRETYEPVHHCQS